MDRETRLREFKDGVSNLVEAFSEIYHEWACVEHVHSDIYAPTLFIIDEYYYWSIDNMYEALYHEASVESVHEYYENSLQNNGKAKLDWQPVNFVNFIKLYKPNDNK